MSFKVNFYNIFPTKYLNKDVIYANGENILAAPQIPNVFFKNLLSINCEDWFAANEVYSDIQLLACYQDCSKGK